MFIQFYVHNERCLNTSDRLQWHYCCHWVSYCTPPLPPTSTHQIFINDAMLQNVTHWFMRCSCAAVSRCVRHDWLRRCCATVSLQTCLRGAVSLSTVRRSSRAVSVAPTPLTRRQRSASRRQRAMTHTCMSQSLNKLYCFTTFATSVNDSGTTKL